MSLCNLESRPPYTPPATAQAAPEKYRGVSGIAMRAKRMGAQHHKTYAALQKNRGEYLTLRPRGCAQHEHGPASPSTPCNLTRGASTHSGSTPPPPLPATCTTLSQSPPHLTCSLNLQTLCRFASHAMRVLSRYTATDTTRRNTSTLYL